MWAITEQRWDFSLGACNTTFAILGVIRYYRPFLGLLYLDMGRAVTAVSGHDVPLLAYPRSRGRLTVLGGERLTYFGSYVTPTQSFEPHLVFRFAVPFNVSLTSKLLSFP
jgi:hypothetical protein